MVSLAGDEPEMTYNDLPSGTSRGERPPALRRLDIRRSASTTQDGSKVAPARPNFPRTREVGEYLLFLALVSAFLVLAGLVGLERLR